MFEEDVLNVRYILLNVKPELTASKPTYHCCEVPSQALVSTVRMN